MSIESSSRQVIRIEELTAVYPGGVTALRGVNLQVSAGEFIAIIGQNGAGKTTLTKHLNALIKPTHGNVWVNGINTRECRTAELARYVGYCFQNPDHQIFNETVWKEVAYGPRQLGFKGEELDETVIYAMDALGLLEFREEHPFVLSKGQRQRVAVASVIAMKPSILVVDEPTTGQDYKQSKDIMNLFRQFNEQGVTVLVVTHDMQLVAEYAQRTIVMGLGQILLDASTREVFREVDLLKSTHLRPPQISTLGFRLGLSGTVLNVTEMLGYLISH